MTKKNIIDLSTYNERRSYIEENTMSDELKEAIQNLIDRLRNPQPLQASANRYAAQIDEKARQ